MVAISLLAGVATAQTPQRAERTLALAALPPPGATGVMATINLAPAVEQFVVDRSLVHANGARSWIGRVGADPRSLVVITSINGVISGTVWRDGRAFGIASVASAADGRIRCEIDELDPAQIVRCRDSAGAGGPLTGPLPPLPETPATEASAADPPGGATPRGGCPCRESAGRIDVLCVYTAAAASGAGGAAALQARVQNALDSTGAVIADSGAGTTTMNMAGFVEIGYDESAPSWDDHLVRLTDPDDGFMDEVQALRDQYSADLVALFVDDPRFTGGQAYYATFWPDAAFSVVNWRAAGAGDLTCAHEFGHNFGCAHDRPNADTGVFFFGFGHHFQFESNELGTVMSYVGAVIPYYSTPLQTYMSGPLLGVPFSDPLPTANALVVQRARWALANFRDSGAIADCNGNGIDDAADIAQGTSLDLNGDCRPDECEARLYVDADALASGDGSSWASASRDLDTALDLARIPCSNVTEIWVADGTYVPGRGSNNPAAHFSLRSGVRLFGGFQGQSRPSGAETSLEQRNPTIYPSVLSGEIGNPDDVSDNVATIVEAIDVGSGAVLDGFTIERGFSPYGGAGLYCQRASPVIRNCYFRDHFTAGSGAAAVLYDGSSPTFDLCRFENNVATGAGGAIAAFDQSSPVLTTTIFVNNSANWGGGFSANNGCAPMLTGCTFAANSAAASAGAVDIYNACTPTFVNCSIVDNLAADWAGGVSISTDSTASFSLCQFIGNEAINVGGGLVAYGSDVAVSAGEFRANHAAYGGGLAVSTLAAAVVSQTVFEDNIVSLGGGGCDVWQSALQMTDCTLAANEVPAGEGGGIRASAGSSVSIRRVNLRDNFASNGGGAIRAWDSDVTVRDGLFLRNSGGSFGGGVALASGETAAATLRIDGAIFKLNHATNGSSGMLELWNADATLINTVGLQNDASGGGGAISLFNASTLNAVNCTLQGNHAGESGGGLLSYDSSVALGNSILWGNTSAQPDVQDQQLSVSGAAPTLEFNCVQGWTGALGGAGNSGADPLFVSAAAGDLHLAPGSPYIDAGSDVLAPADGTDRDGDADVAEAIPWDAEGAARFVDVGGAANTGLPDPARPALGPIDRGAYETAAPACPGDIDGDADVDLGDLATLLSHFGTPSGAQPADGDLDGDGDVDLGDLATLLAHFGGDC